VRHEACVLPVIADESCAKTEGDVERCAGPFSGVDVGALLQSGRPDACTAHDPAGAPSLRVSKVMVGAACESSIGISATAQLLPLLDGADLEQVPLLLGKDVAEGVED